MGLRDALQRAMDEAQQGRLSTAMSSLRTLQRLHPRDLEVLTVLGLLLKQSGQHEQAIHHLQVAVNINPSLPGTHNNLANALVGAHRFNEAQSHYLAAIKADPTYARAYLGLLTTRIYLNYSSGALEAAERGLALKPDWPELSPNYARAHWDFGDCFTSAADPPSNDRSPERPLRIGILSGDLATHSVAYFADAMFRHPPDGWHISAFSTASARGGDGIAAELRGLAHSWCDAATWSDEAIDAAIRAARIYILIELGGHTSGGRLTALNRKPAPIIGTCIGYPNTTGHPHIDLRIVDSTTDPPGSDSHGRERPSFSAARVQRTGWDSNPRYGYPYTAFPMLLLQPLGHLSKVSCLASLV